MEGVYKIRQRLGARRLRDDSSAQTAIDEANAPAKTTKTIAQSDEVD